MWSSKSPLVGIERGRPKAAPVGSNSLARSLFGARFANDDLGSAVEWQIVELHAEALAVLVRPGCADRRPEALVASFCFRDCVDAVRRALGGGCGLCHLVSFRALRSPGWQSRCPFGHRCGWSEAVKP